MKNLKGVKRDARKVFSLLNGLSKEIGAYAVSSSWEYDEKLKIQCDDKKLIEFATKNNLSITWTEKQAQIDLGEIILFRVL